MPSLRSSLFKGDLKLEAAASFDAAHIARGSAGEHVRKVQLALNEVNQAGLKPDGRFGPLMAAAVLAYKKDRKIINHRYQRQADDIVGKMTVRALDSELVGAVVPRVIIGRPTFYARSAHPLLALNATPQPGVTTSAIIRGNPYVRAGARDIGLPPSVPPGHAYEVDISVTPPITNDDFIELEIINTSPNNGVAVVRPPKIITSTKVIVLGSTATKPGNAGKLQIQAALNGRVLATSPGFSVCAHPVSVTCSFKAIIDDGDHIGMKVNVALESDSGFVGHLDKAEFSEAVEVISEDNPPFSPGGVMVQPGFLPCTAKPQFEDSHGSRPSRGRAGKQVVRQVYIFNCAICGAARVPIPKSGFEIVANVRQAGTDYEMQVTKAGAAGGVSVREDDGHGHVRNVTFNSHEGLGTATSPGIKVPEKYGPKKM